MASSSSPAIPTTSPFFDTPPNSSRFPRTHLLLFPSKPSSRVPNTLLFLCHSSPTSPPPSSSSSSTPSLSDQLRPLSLTILQDQQLNRQSQDQGPSHLHLSRKPKSTWVNPSRPRPKVLTLHRHRRAAPFSDTPDFRRLSAVSRKLAALPVDDADPDDADLAAFDDALKEVLPDPPSRESALVILNGLRPWQNAYRFFRWLKAEAFFPMDVIFYNVAMKSLRFGRRYDLVDRLAHEMIDAGVELDNVTYSTVISCAKRCREFDRAIEWFERMYRTGLMPDEVTYSAVLDVYAKLGKVEEVMSLFERGRASGWTPDPVAFSVLGKMFGEAGDYDGIQYVLGEMKGLGVEPNLVVYNTLLEAMGKAGKPGLARNLFEEMLAAGLTPNEKTLTALIKIYGKARSSRDALELWERMKANKWPMDFILYNTLLSMCADLGLEEEAERLFADMKRSERSRPDSWSYAAMVNIYASGGKVDKALRSFEEMLESGVEPNVMSCTCLIQCFGKAKRIDDVVRVFDVLIERGIKPDDRLCGCLLSVAAVCGEGEMDKVLACLERANPRLVRFVKLLKDDQVVFDVLKDEFRTILNETDVDARRPFCNCLIDICRNQNFPFRRAQELFSLGMVYGLYPGLHTKVSNEWSLNLRSLSVGAAYTAFEDWMRMLASNVNRKEALPQMFSVHTGTGSHKFSNGLANSFASHLAKLAVPFRQNEENSGCFVASREELVPWIQAGASP